MKKKPKARSLIAHALEHPLFKLKIIPPKKGKKPYVRKEKHPKKADNLP